MPEHWVSRLLLYFLQILIEIRAVSDSSKKHLWKQKKPKIDSDLFCNTLFYGNAIKSVISTLLWTGIGECVISVTARSYLYLFWLILLDFFYGMLTV